MDQNYTLPGIMQYLQSQFTTVEKNRMAGELEKSSLKAKIVELEGERNSLRLVNDRLSLRVRDLEQRLRKYEPDTEMSIEDEIEKLQLDTVDVAKLLRARQFLKTSTSEILYLLNSSGVEATDPLNLNKAVPSFEPPAQTAEPKVPDLPVRRYLKPQPESDAETITPEDEEDEKSPSLRFETSIKAKDIKLIGLFDKYVVGVSQNTTMHIWDKNLRLIRSVVFDDSIVDIKYSPGFLLVGTLVSVVLFNLATFSKTVIHVSGESISHLAFQPGTNRVLIGKGGVLELAVLDFDTGSLERNRIINVTSFKVSHASVIKFLDESRFDIVAGGPFGIFFLNSDTEEDKHVLLRQPEEIKIGKRYLVMKLGGFLRVVDLLNSSDSTRLQSDAAVTSVSIDESDVLTVREGTEVSAFSLSGGKLGVFTNVKGTSIICDGYSLVSCDADEVYSYTVSELSK